MRGQVDDIGWPMVRRRILWRVKAIGLVTFALFCVTGYTNLGDHLGMSRDVAFHKYKNDGKPVDRPYVP